MLNVRNVALILSLFSFVLMFSFQIFSDKLVKSKFEHVNDSVIYRSKTCFYLKWKNTTTTLSELKTYHCKRFITIGHCKGRTGNNLFQIATILGLAYRYDLIPIVPLACPLHKYFNLPNIVDLKKERLSNYTNLRANKAAIYSDFSKRLSSEFHNFTIDGYFQSWRYFNTERDIIRKALRIKTEHFEKSERYMKKVNPSVHTQICIHIRRGDFLEPKHFKNGFAVVDVKFVEKAKNILRQNASNVVFLVATDDKQWCQENLKNVNMSPFDNPGDDLALMTLSDHVVVSTGSFGWWGAWLAGGKVDYYKEYPRSKSYMARHFNKHDYYPTDWIGIV